MDFELNLRDTDGRMFISASVTGVSLFSIAAYLREIADDCERKARNEN